MSATREKTEPCRHDSIVESAGIRVCLDCGALIPKRHRRNSS